MTFPKYDAYGRPRRFVSDHNLHGRAALADLNRSRDFGVEGCFWHDLNTRELAEKTGLRRVYSGGETGTLIGYARAGALLDGDEWRQFPEKHL